MYMKILKVQEKNNNKKNTRYKKVSKTLTFIVVPNSAF